MTVDNATAEQGVAMTDSAADQILRVREKRQNPKLRFRIAVAGGGCNGFQYMMEFDDIEQEDDIIITHDNGAELVTDSSSAPFLAGATLTFSKDLMGSRFDIDNPNAASGCGCGVSFSL